MNYNLKVSNVEASDEVRSYLEKKLETIDKLLGKREQSARADIELSYLESEEKSFEAECTLHDGPSLHAKVRGATLHESIDALIDELGKELTKEHKKHTDQARKGALKAKDFLRGLRRSI